MDLFLTVLNGWSVIYLSNNMEVNVYCSKELFILEVEEVLHTPQLPEKMTISHFLLLCCDVEKYMWNIHWNSMYILKLRLK